MASYSMNPFENQLIGYADIQRFLFDLKRKVDHFEFNYIDKLEFFCLNKLKSLSVNFETV